MRRNNPGDLMTVEQVAAHLQLNKITIYKYIRAGELPAVRIGRSLRVWRADVDGFLEGHKVRPPARQQTAKGETGRRAAPPVAPTNTPPASVGFGEPADVPEERRRREVLIGANPLEWVVRGLH